MRQSKNLRGLPFSNQFQIDPCFRLIEIWIGDQWRTVSALYRAGETHHLLLPDIDDRQKFKWPVKFGLIVIRPEATTTRQQINSLSRFLLKQQPIALVIYYPDGSWMPVFSGFTLDVAAWFQRAGCQYLFDEKTHKEAAEKLINYFSESRNG